MSFRVCGVAFVFLIGCLKTYASGIKESDLWSNGAQMTPPRDAKRPKAKFDREAVFLSEVKKGKASGTIPPAYRDGDCSAAPSPELKLFCEGKYTEIREKDLVYFGYGNHYMICEKIEDEPLKRYCQATADDNTIASASCYPHPKGSPEEKYTFLCYEYFGEDWGKYRDLPRGSYASTPAAAPAPAAGGAAKPACKRRGAAVAGPDECCEGSAEFNPNATDAQRREGRDKRCSL